MRQTVFALFAALMLLVGHSSHAATFKVATLSPDGSFWMKTMREAGKEVEAATDNRVKFKWYPGGVMGDDKAVLRKMRVGQLQGAALPMGELLSFYPDSQAYGIPFLFNSYDEVDYVRSQLDDSLITGFAEGGMEVLGIAEGGFGYFLTAEPVRVPADLQQQKVWVPQNDVVSARLAQTGFPLGCFLRCPKMAARLPYGWRMSETSALREWCACGRGSSTVAAHTSLDRLSHGVRHVLLLLLNSATTL